MAVGQSVVTLTRSTNLEVDIELLETIISELKIREPIKMNFCTLTGLSALGRIRKISLLVNRRIRTYTIRIILNLNLLKLRLGMTATALNQL